jgi:poly-gamma-glutamate synthesis protein (capsule biosynthesis protein)
MANNHIGDYTRLALEDTLTLGREAGFHITGGGFSYYEAIEPNIVEVKGIQIGYLAFSDFGPQSILASATNASSSGILSASDPNIQAIIFDASQKCDLLVVSYHFGDEYKPLSNSRQQYLARLAIDAGADIVAGAHPHVEQQVEEYKGGVIAYSLGNFIFDQNFSAETMRGMKLDVVVTKNGIESYSTSTIYMNENYQPHL